MTDKKWEKQAGIDRYGKGIIKDILFKHGKARVICKKHGKRWEEARAFDDVCLECIEKLQDLL